MSVTQRGLARTGLSALLFGLLPAVGIAHGDDQWVLAALTEEIAHAPDAALFIRRGELLRHLQEWTRAEADFVEATRRDATLVNVDFFRARLWLEAGAPQRALPFAERFVARVPAGAEGRFLRGDILAALDRNAAAAADYASGIERVSSPRPEHFLRHAQLLGAPPRRDLAAALAALDAGIERIGPIVTLVDAAIVLELERKNFEGALRRVAAAMAKAPRREAWLVRQGDILVQCGHAGEAAAAYRAALAAIEELPERYRQTVPVEKLARDARTSLQRISSN